MNRLKLVLLVAALALPVSSTQAFEWEDSVEFDECNDMPWTSNNKKKDKMKCFKQLADTRISELQSAWDKRDGRRDEQLPRIEEWEYKEANWVQPCDGVGIAELLLNGVGVTNGGGGVVIFDTNDDGGIPGNIANNNNWKCTEESNWDEVVIPDYDSTTEMTYWNDDGGTLDALVAGVPRVPVDHYDKCSARIWAAGKGDKKNCFVDLVRALEEELRVEAVHYDELEEAWTKKVQSFYAGRGDQSVDLYLSESHDRLDLWERLGYPQVKVIQVNADYLDINTCADIYNPNGANCVLHYTSETDCREYPINDGVEDVCKRENEAGCSYTMSQVATQRSYDGTLGKRMTYGCVGEATTWR